MNKPALNTLAVAAALFLLSAPIASAGSDGTCAGSNYDELAVTQLPSANTPVSSEASDYTKVAEATWATRNTVAVVASLTGDPRANAPESAAEEPSPEATTTDY